VLFTVTVAVSREFVMVDAGLRDNRIAGAPRSMKIALVVSQPLPVNAGTVSVLDTLTLT